MLIYLFGALALLAIFFFFYSPRVATVEGFFKGHSDTGESPSLWTLTLSQVTTWIFARSLLTAAILGYYYGIAGALAYTAYYLSFLSGAKIIDHLRFQHGFDNIQGFMSDRFGRTGEHCFNVVIALRLLSEVFSNLLVIGLIFGLSGTVDFYIAMAATAGFTFVYSMFGGLRASLKTDVFQAVLVFLALFMLFALMVLNSGFQWQAVIQSSPDITSPGWVLLLVALLQIWSYPLHDPVMMDRGFIADRQRTKNSFYLACAISMACIFLFALLGVFGGLYKQEGEALVATLTRIFGEPYMLVFNLTLIVSAVSTLDSTFSSASKLVAVDMGIMKPTQKNGRLVMLAFLVGGAFFLALDSKDLYAAVAVSGTASMFLAPVIVFNIWNKQHTATWSLVVSFITALAGALLYLVESSGYTQWMNGLGYEHKYSKLLIICIAVLTIGFVSFIIGRKKPYKS